MGKIRFGRVGFFIEIVIICLICGVFVLSVAIPYNTNSASAANKGSSYIVRLRLRSYRRKQFAFTLAYGEYDEDDDRFDSYRKLPT